MKCLVKEIIPYFMPMGKIAQGPDMAAKVTQYSSCNGVSMAVTFSGQVEDELHHQGLWWQQVWSGQMQFFHIRSIAHQTPRRD